MATTACKSFSSKVIFGGVNKDLLVVRDKEGKNILKDGERQWMKELDLYVVMGVVTGSKIRPSQYGENVMYQGEFKAINLDTGEEFESNQFYPPPILSAQLDPKVTTAGSKGYEFAVTIGIKPEPKSATGYVYYQKHVKEIAESDVVKKLQAEIASKLPPIRNKKK